MKKKSKYMLILLIFLSLSTGYSQDQYELKGKIDQQFNGQQIMLFTFDDDMILKVDTSEIIGGYFHFKGDESLKDIGILSVGNYPDTVVSQIVILDTGNINVDMDKSRVGGTYLNNLYQTYLDTTVIFRKELGELTEKEENSNIVKSGTPRERKLIETGKYTVNFKKQNIDNVVGQYFFEKEAGKSIAENQAYPATESCPDSAFYIVYNAAGDNYKQKEWIQKYIERIEKKRQLSQQQERMLSQPYIDFDLTDSSGNSRKISDYVGKSRFTLLDFWASWCAPCIASFPELKGLYEKYNRDDFEIIGISLDTNEKAWKDVLRRVDTPWIQLIGGTRELETKIMEAYSFKAIPFAVLIDKEGNIIDSGHALKITYRISQLIE